MTADRADEVQDDIEDTPDDFDWGELNPNVIHIPATGVFARLVYGSVVLDVFAPTSQIPADGYLRQTTLANIHLDREAALSLGLNVLDELARYIEFTGKEVSLDQEYAKNLAEFGVPGRLRDLIDATFAAVEENSE